VVLGSTGRDPSRAARGRSRAEGVAIDDVSGYCPLMPTSYTHDSPHLAETYDRLSDSQFEGGKRLVDRIGIKAGDQVLDVGCGTGRLATWIAERVAPTGTIVGIDPLAERIALARARTPAVTFEVGQAQDLSAFADGSFDAVCLSAVLHWVGDKPKALAEVRRVLRPGGRVGVTTLSRELLGAGTNSAVLIPVLSMAPYANKVDMSAMAIASNGHTTTELISMVVESRLELAELHVHARTRRYASGDDVVDFMEASSFGNFLRLVPEEMRPSLRADLVAAFEARKGPDRIVTRDYGTLFVATRV
jgi:arsenite methyltransferase